MESPNRPSKLKSSFILLFGGMVVIVIAAALSFLLVLGGSQKSFIGQKSPQSGFSSSTSALDTYGYRTIAIDLKTSSENVPITAEIADTSALQAQGLSDRLSLDPDHGMWFVFSNPGKPQFWMKDMQFPIDIIWFDDSLTVVDITHDFSPDSYPKTIAPVAPVRYVLEVSAGFALTHNVKIGDHAEVK